MPGIKEYIDFKTMAAQVGAITAINNVENPGGNIELVGDNAIDIIPDEELPKIKISELHSPRTNNPHQTTARQVGALVSVGGVRNPGGDVYLRHDKSITITPDDEANSITISETHSSLTGNPHGTTAGDVEALSITGGTVNGNLTVDGKVGIGTTNPGFKFVTSTDVAEWTAKILNTNSAAYGLSIENINSTAGYGLAVYTGSGTGFFVRNNGCVGIGTNDPKEKLHVNGSVRGNVNGALRIGTGNGYVDIGPQNTGFSHFQTDRPAFYFNKEIVVYSGFIGTYDENLQLRTSRTTRMIIRSDNGNVGIGTDPGEKLHINGSVRGNISGALRISTGHGYVDIGPKHPCCAHFYTDRPLYYFDKEIIVDTGCIGSHSEDLQLRTASTTRMTIRIDNGNVGIGTTEPKGKLDVNGQVVYQGVIGDNIYWDSAKRHWTYAKEGAGYALRNDGNGNLEFRFAPKGSPGDNAGPGTRVIFTNSGNVGIGTASPGTTLEVRNGTLRVSGGASHGQDSARLVIDPGPSWGHCFFECRNVNGVMYRIYGDGSTNARYVSSGSSDYAEYFESKNGKEIKPGTSVVLEDSKIRSAKKNEIPIGVISASPGIVGGVHIEWPKRYLKDEFGKVIMEEYKEEILVPKKEKVKKERQKMEKKKVKEKVKRTEVVKKKGKYYQVEVEETVERDIEEPVFKEVDLYDDVSKKKIGKHKIPVMETYEEEIDVLDDKGQPVMVGSGKFETKTSPKINPDYDEKKEYIPREKRPEWNCVGLLGQLPLRKGQPVAPTWIKI
ncbi:MAG: hypothetical protein GTN68_08100, partial [Candidatus Aminicenantes bacterium]|nr:hypothetical protein [Candidatus Aminicenantes bacterium]